MNHLTTAKEKYQSLLMEKQNVVGVGIGFKTVKQRRTDQLSIVVLVEKKLPIEALNAEDVVQAELDGIPTDVQEIGTVRALNIEPNEKTRTGKWRPAPGGVSIGHHRITAGTLGTLVFDRRTGERLILSNNHVLANCNDAEPKDPILQPGPYDGGQNNDKIAELFQFVPVRFLVDDPTCGLTMRTTQVANTFLETIGSSHRFRSVRINNQENTVDAAVALPLKPELVDDEILDIGTVEGTKEAELGMTVQKSGRTTGCTAGTIDVIDTTVRVLYSYDRVAVFTHQLVSNLKSQGGDSGSVLVSDSKAVGLLFAGSENSSICNPIGLVLDPLDVRIQ